MLYSLCYVFSPSPSSIDLYSGNSHYHHSTFKCRELRYGDTVESVINILPLRIGELVLDGFYLEESHDRAGSALGSAYPPGAGAVK